MAMNDDLSKNLNAEQKQAVSFGEGPLLIVAGAGTGKTTVITQRLKWLIDQKKASGEEILALTFTEKAAAEMEERIDKILPYGYLDLWIMTFHSFAEKILKDNALEIGLSNDFKLLDLTQQWSIVRQNLEKFNLDYYRPLGNPAKFIHALLKLFSRAKDESIWPEDYLKYVEDLKLNSDSPDFVQTVIDRDLAQTLSKKEKKELIGSEIKKQEEVADAYHVYQQLLLDNNSLDFGDLINYCLKLFKDRPLVLNKYRKKFKYILVDEFQDTNHAQYELIKALAAPKNNLTVVGDDDQAIFKFRGASVSNILEFKKDFPETRSILLTKNYRSCQNILNLSYEFIKQNNPDRLEVKLKSGEKKISKQLVSQNNKKGLINHFQAATAEDEVKAVLKQILDLKDSDKESTWNDFGVLVRANAHANLFIYGLEKAQIPYQFMASTGLYTKPVVLDVISYLKLLDNYHESSALYRIISLPIFDLESGEIVNLNYWSYRKAISLYQTLLYTSKQTSTETESKEKFSRIINLIDKHSALTRKSKVGEVIRAFLEDSGYLRRLTAAETVAAQNSLGYLNQFYKKVIEFENSSSDPSVKNFLQFIDMQIEAGDEGKLQNDFNAGPEILRIMTVHAAKGLEFKYVFIVNLVDRRFPVSQRGEPIELPEKLIKEILPEGDAHLQEERRLFYVAMTRAKEGLFFTSAKDYGGAAQKKLSRFLTELNQFGLALNGNKSTDKKSLLEIAPENEKEPRLQYIVPVKFSFTQIRAFESCPYQYRFAHILKVPVRGKGIFSFGKTIHSTLQKFFDLAKQRAGSEQKDLFGNSVKNSEASVSVGQLLEIYKNSWIDDWYASREDKEKYRTKGEKILKEFYKSLNGNIPLPLYLELPFNLKIETGGDIITLKGVIDRVDEIKDGFEIIDYKTGEARGDRLSANDKEQLLIYQMAAARLFDKPVAKLSYYYVDSNKKVSFLGTEKELEKLQKKIVFVVNEIKKGEFPSKPSILCKYCDFKNICEYRNL
ncbi:PD-(D/E)XK nuclease family protein [Candidatus Parcubacteria bacterium]|nr:MAG: PD-(D/E)XK nuclease family protein [Candidatus Parcubacteria bacterium]